MTDYLTNDTDLGRVATAIRTKLGSVQQMEYPNGFVEAINAIPSGTGGNVPEGGTAGQILAKASNTDFDTTWINNEPTAMSFNNLSNRPKYANETMTGLTNIPEVKTATWDAKQNQIYAGTGITLNTNVVGIDTASIATKLDVSNLQAAIEAVLQSQYYNKGAIDDKVDILSDAIDAKQDIISNLDTIAAGAALGATSVQPATLTSYSTTTQMNSAISTAVSGKQDTISDLATIRNNASTGAAKREVPASTVADAGKFLVVNASGVASWNTIPNANGEEF